MAATGPRYQQKRHELKQSLLSPAKSKVDEPSGVQVGVNSQRTAAHCMRGAGTGSVDRGRSSRPNPPAAGSIASSPCCGGYPTETQAERAETLALAEQLGASGARIRCYAFMPLPGTRLHNARPAPIDAASAARLARLESSGVLHGPWRGQQQIARRLVTAFAAKAAVRA
jgi:hypothetical protein